MRRPQRPIFRRGQPVTADMLNAIVDYCVGSTAAPAVTVGEGLVARFGPAGAGSGVRIELDAGLRAMALAARANLPPVTPVVVTAVNAAGAGTPPTADEVTYDVLNTVSQHESTGANAIAWGVRLPSRWFGGGAAISPAAVDDIGFALPRHDGSGAVAWDYLFPTETLVVEACE